MMDNKNVWTDADFDEMGWHDNHVHGMRFVAGEDGTGDLVFDLDYILEWGRSADSEFEFSVVPVTLTFHGVVFPRIEIDYGAMCAEFGPFAIAGIERQAESESTTWTLPIDWPGGEITFQATGFTQCTVGDVVVTPHQSLTPAQRGSTSA